MVKKIEDSYYTASEAAQKLGLKYTTFMARVRAGKYSSVVFGTTHMIPRKEINQHVHNQPMEKPKG